MNCKVDTFKNLAQLLAFAFFILFLACKKKHETTSDSSGLRTGLRSGNSCSSHANYQRRNREELAILAQEFIASCFVDPSISAAVDAAGSKAVPASDAKIQNRLNLRKMESSAAQFNLLAVPPSTTPDGMWAPAYTASPTDDEEEVDESDMPSIPGTTFNPQSIFHYKAYDSDVFNAYFDAAKRDRIRRVDKAFGEVVEYGLVPNEFLKGGKLAFLDLERLDNGKFQANEKDWRDSLKGFSEVCKSQLLAMRDRTQQVVEAYKGFTEKGCCRDLPAREDSTNAGDGKAILQGTDFSKGLLSCAGMDYAQLKAAYPANTMEWPTCGGAEDAVCSPQSIFPISTAAAPIHCHRCDLRITAGKWYSQKNDKLGVNYDLKIAQESQITCRTPAAARSAIATWCITQKSRICESFNLDTTPIVDVFARITPWLHCSEVSIRGEPVGDPSMDSKMTSLDYLTSSAAGGEFGVGSSASINAGFLNVAKFEGKIELKLTQSASAVRTSHLQIRSKGSDPIYVLRSGRVEFSPLTGIYCSASTTRQSCVTQDVNASATAQGTLPLPGATASVSTLGSVRGNTSDCVQSGVQENTDLNAQTASAGGLSLQQALAICAAQNAFDGGQSYSLIDGFTIAGEALVQKLNGGEGFDNWLPSLKQSSSADSSLFSLDVSRRNLYCAEPAKNPQENGTHFLSIALRIDTKGKLTMDIGIESKRFNIKKYGQQITMDMDGSDGDILGKLINPTISNEILLTSLQALIKKNPTKKIIGASLGEFTNQKCGFIDLPTHFDLSESPITCVADGEDAASTEKWKVGFLNTVIEDGEMKVTAFSQQMQAQLVTRTKIDHLGTWPTLLRQGVLTANDGLKILEVGYQLQNGSQLSCIPDK